MSEHFGGNIAYLRKKNNLSQSDFALSFHVSRQAVSKWEQGRSLPDAGMLTAVSEKFGVSLDALVNTDLSAVLKAAPIPFVPEYKPEPMPQKEVERKKNPLGILFLLPLVFIFWFAFVRLLFHVFRAAFTSFNMLELPIFNGLANFSNFFSDAVFGIAFRNSIVFAVLLVFFCGPLAFGVHMLAKKSHTFFKYALPVVFLTVSVFYLMNGISGKMLLESFMAWGTEKEGLTWILNQKWNYTLSCLGCCFGVSLLLAAVFPKIQGGKTAFTRILFPFAHSAKLYAAGAGALLVLPMYENLSISVAGFPSADYALHNITLYILDYGVMRFDVGYAYAVILFFMLILLALLCVWIGISCLCMNVIKHFVLMRNTPKPARNRKPICTVFSGLLFLFGLFALSPFITTMLISFKPMSELFEFPFSLLPARPTLAGYMDLFGQDGARILFNLVLYPLIPSLIWTFFSALSSFGLAHYTFAARRKLLCIFVLLYSLIPALQIFQADSVTHDAPLVLCFASLFCGILPLISLLYQKKVIEAAGQREKSRGLYMILSSVPVFFLSMVFCVTNGMARMYIVTPQYRLWLNMSEAMMNASVYAAALTLQMLLVLFFTLTAGVAGAVVHHKAQSNKKGGYSLV